MSQVKSTTNVKRAQKVEDYIEELKVKLRNDKERIDSISKEIIEITDTYKTFPIETRHNTEQYKQLAELNDEIVALKESIMELITLTSDVLYANVEDEDDVHAYEVIKMQSPTCFEVRRLKTTLINLEEVKKTKQDNGTVLGYYNNDIQQWDYEVDKKGEKGKIKLVKDDWMMNGHKVSLSTSPEEFYNFCS